MKQLIITTFTILSLASCASSIPINLSCDEQHIEIYVNDEYAGRGLIHYIVPKGDDYINVSCRERSEEHTSEIQSHHDLVCRLKLEKR